MNCHNNRPNRTAPPIQSIKNTRIMECLVINLMDFHTQKDYKFPWYKQIKYHNSRLVDIP